MKRNRKPANEPDDVEKNIINGYLDGKTKLRDAQGALSPSCRPGNPILDVFDISYRLNIERNHKGIIGRWFAEAKLLDMTLDEIYALARKCLKLKRKEQLSPSRLAKLKATGKKGAVAAELTKGEQEKKDRVAIMADFNKRLSANRRQYQRTEAGYLKLEAICEEVANRHLGANGKPIMSASAIRQEHYRRKKRNRNKAAT